MVCIRNVYKNVKTSLNCIIFYSKVNLCCKIFQLMSKSFNKYNVIVNVNNV